MELYKEDLVWDIEDYENGLEEIYKNHKIPDVTKVPEMVQGVLLKCFNYEPSCRPSITEIANELEKL